MRNNGRERREGDRVTRRSGTKLFGRSEARSAERIHAFDDYREEADASARRPRREGNREDYRAEYDGYRGERRRDYEDDYRDRLRTTGFHSFKSAVFFGSLPNGLI